MNASNVEASDEVEVWRPVVGYPRYEVSSAGRVRTTPRILKGTNREGYLVVGITGHRGSGKYVHRLVLEAFEGEAPPLHVGRHLNGDSLDNRKSNLKWGTPSENNADTLRHGRFVHLKGERQNHAKLTEAAVRDIRKLAEEGHKHTEIARRFGVCRATIGAVVRRETWGHI